jgi:hypothetical protein
VKGFDLGDEAELLEVVSWHLVVYGGVEDLSELGRTKEDGGVKGKQWVVLGKERGREI